MTIEQHSAPPSEPTGLHASTPAPVSPGETVFSVLGEQARRDLPPLSVRWRLGRDDNQRRRRGKQRDEHQAHTETTHAADGRALPAYCPKRATQAGSRAEPARGS